MASNVNPVIQYDNAVIDYTTIAALIEAVNSHQNTIDQLVAGTLHTVQSTDSSGNVIGQTTGTKKVYGNSVPITTNSIHTLVDLSKGGFTAPPVVVGVVLSAGSKPVYCHMQTAPTKDKADFHYSVKTPAGAVLHYIAVGL
jgi:hypothetical protein